MARVRKGEITFYNLDGDEIEKELKTIAVIPLQLCDGFNKKRASKCFCSNTE